MAMKRCRQRGKFPSMDAPDPAFKINSLIRQLSEAQKFVESLEGGYAVKKQELEEALNEKCEQPNHLIDRLVLEIFTYLEDNRRILTRGGRKKILRFVAGVIQQRFTPWGTNIRNQKKIMKWMKRHGFDRYIRRRVIEEIDRQLLIRDKKKVAGKIKGVSISRTKMFIVTPATTGISVTRPVERLIRLREKAKKTQKNK